MCQRHDFGYQNSRKMHRFTKSMRERIDQNFRDDMYDKCDATYNHWYEVAAKAACRTIAYGYYTAVKLHDAGKYD